MKTPKPRNPQDATRRNVQAVNKRLAGLEKRIEQLETLIKELQAQRQRSEVNQ